MEYEICKKNNDGTTWSTIAQADTWNWAKEIADSLNCNCWSDGIFRVFKNGKQIDNLKMAMKEM